MTQENRRSTGLPRKVFLLCLLIFHKKEVLVKMEATTMWGEFCNTFGTTGRNRVIEFFLEGRELDFGLGDVAERTGLIRATAYNVADELLKEGILVLSRKVGRTQLYKLNLAEPKVKVFIEAFNMMLQRIAEQEGELEIERRIAIPA